MLRNLYNREENVSKTKEKEKANHESNEGPTNQPSYSHSLILSLFSQSIITIALARISQLQAWFLSRDLYILIQYREYIHHISYRELYAVA